MDCKIENEKSIDQIALEDYVWKKGTDKFLKEAKTAAFLVGCLAYLLSIILLAYDSLIWNGGFDGIVVCLFLCLMPAGMAGAQTLALYSFFSGLYRGKEKIKKFIVNLSQKEKDKITKEYLENELKKHEDNIAYCEREITPLKKSIQYHKEKIEKLESELEKFK
ncbi:MAG: hypothetical protein WAZ12_00205 [Candidatus Absconditicoccaceae bacterium]